MINVSKMKQSDASIQRKLMRVILLTSGVVLLLTCAAFFAYEYITFRQATVRKLSTLGEIIASNSTAALAFDDKDNASEILNALKAEKHIVAAALYDTTGQLFSTYPAAIPDKDFPTRLESAGYRFTNAAIEGYQPVVQGTKRLGTLYLKSDMEAIYDRFRLYGIIASIFIGVSFLFAYLLSRRLQRSISMPILKLAQMARAVSDRRDYTVRATKYSNDELGILTDAFNHMLTQIEAQNLAITSFNHRLEQKVKERTLELEEANEVLTQQNDFIETIIDSSVHILAVLDEDMRFTAINKACEQVYNIRRQQVLGKIYTDVFPQAKGSKAYNDIVRALHGEKIHNTVTHSAIIGGYFENYFIPLKQSDQVYGVLVLSHDVTAIMEASEKLKVLNSELETSNRDLEQFAYIASHDLQEPLRKIQTYSELAEINLNNEEAAKKYFEKINASAKRMANLIKAVLNYSRLSKTDEVFEEVNLNAIIDNVKTDLELLIAEKKAVIHTAALPVISGIALQLNQLFFNLISNALKFSEKPPVVHISSKIISHEAMEVTDGIKTDGDYAEITVADNGIGFSQEYAGKIFNIFQRLHSQRSYAGTGIGLALCKKIVDNHNGSILVNSEPGRGTTFYIYLPVVHTVKTTGKITVKSDIA